MANIRTATITDAAGIAHVHVHSWKETYRGIVPDSYLESLSVEKRAAKWSEWLTQGNATVYVAEENGEVVGFVSGGKNQRPELGIDGELAAMYLLKDHQKKGIGRKLFEAMVEALKNRQFKQMSLWVIPENTTVDFYKKMGGLRAGEDSFELGGKKLTEHLYVWTLG